MDIIASDKPPPRPAWPLYRALVGVGVVCSLLIVGVYLGTAKTIEANRAALLERAVLKVLPGATSYQPFALEQIVYAGFDAGGKLMGIAIETQGMGYQDVIRILYGYSPASQSIIGMQVMESKETPGLGDKIETDVNFLANFKNLDVRTAGMDSLLHPIELVKPGRRTEGWHMDAISGATISSSAIARMLQSSTAEIVPKLYSQREIFSLSSEVKNGP